MNLFLIAVIFIVAFFILVQIYFALVKTETQSYKLIRKERDFEIRYYPAATMATIISSATSYKELGNPGFKKLAKYIFGGNDKNTRIAMTSPVHMEIDKNISMMSFVMPSAYLEGNLPIPNDQSVVISMSKPEYVAAIKFSGFATDGIIKSKRSKLEKALKLFSIPYYGNFRFLGYNAPYQLLDRKNEIIVSINHTEFY